MIDHFTLTVADLARSKEFYSKALEPLGYRIVMDFGQYVGYGDKKPYFWLKQGTPQAPMHVAFKAADRAAVDAFHAAALAAGARDDGAPGLREHYHPHYYGAFVVELDGHPIEAVCHTPPGAPKQAAAKKPAAKKPAAKKATRKPAKKSAKKGARR